MLENFVQNPTSFSLDTTVFESFQYGQSIIQYTGQPLHLKNIDVALLGWGASNDYVQIRKALYTLSANFKLGKVLDLGLVHNNLVPLTEVIDLLLQKGIFPIVISSDALAIEGQLKAYEQRFEMLNMAMIDSMLPYSTTGKPLIINRLLQYYPHLLSHLNCIGSQSYLVDKKALDFLEDKYFEVHRLGKIQARLEEIEPMVRHVDLTTFSIASIRAADAPANSYKNPNGLLAAEACKIMRYITMSDQLSSLCIHGFDGALSQDQGQTANMIAQLIWFAIEGFNARMQEFPVFKNDLRAYVVDNKTLDLPISFYKSNKSDRWWFEIPGALSPKHQLIPCSYLDYKIACEGDLPERLLNAINRLQ